MDSAFLLCLQDLNIDHKLEWEEVREKIQEENAFKAITLESERIRLFKVFYNCLLLFVFFFNLIKKLILLHNFKEYQHMMEEACLHVHRTKKSKKNKKVKKRSHSVVCISFNVTKLRKKLIALYFNKIYFL